jgi:hypothetical protein
MINFTIDCDLVELPKPLIPYTLSEPSSNLTIISKARDPKEFWEERRIGAEQGYIFLTPIVSTHCHGRVGQVGHVTSLSAPH